MGKLEKLSSVRQYERYRVKDRAYVKMTDSTVMFHIIDISKNGLAFHYVGKEQWFSNLLELDILFYGHGLCLRDFPIISISDYSINNSAMPMRRHSVMFNNLKSYQIAQLSRFIKSYSEGNA